MSIREEIEDIERNCWKDRYSSSTLEAADEANQYFDDLEKSAQFVAKYRDFYSDEDIFDDPVDYAESWHDSFGYMDGIISSLEE